MKWKYYSNIHKYQQKYIYFLIWWEFLWLYDNNNYAEIM